MVISEHLPLTAAVLTFRHPAKQPSYALFFSPLLYSSTLLLLFLPSEPSATALSPTTSSLPSPDFPSSLPPLPLSFPFLLTPSFHPPSPVVDVVLSFYPPFPVVVVVVLSFYLSPLVVVIVVSSFSLVTVVFVVVPFSLSSLARVESSSSHVSMPHLHHKLP